MALPCIGREHDRLSVTDGCRWRRGDGVNVQQRMACRLVKIAHSRKFNRAGHRGGPASFLAIDIRNGVAEAFDEISDPLIFL
jgi:hypothetical protein